MQGPDVVFGERSLLSAEGASASRTVEDYLPFRWRVGGDVTRLTQSLSAASGPLSYRRRVGVGVVQGFRQGETPYGGQTGRGEMGDSIRTGQGSQGLILCNYLDRACDVDT